MNNSLLNIYILNIDISRLGREIKSSEFGVLTGGYNN
jgi:hypothetical protein